MLLTVFTGSGGCEILRSFLKFIIRFLMWELFEKSHAWLTVIAIASPAQDFEVLEWLISNKHGMGLGARGSHIVFLFVGGCSQDQRDRLLSWFLIIMYWLFISFVHVCIYIIMCVYPVLGLWQQSLAAAIPVPPCHMMSYYLLPICVHTDKARTVIILKSYKVINIIVKVIFVFYPLPLTH